MTSLQATAMGGGAASTKTASYSLLSTDAGTTVAMNAAGATTITVDTGLFAAGDTVFIQNVGAGVCTITAGTATVDTAGALALPQYDAGILYFTSASAAIFYDYIQVGAASPLTTKGDLYTFSTSDTRLGVGANGTVLTAASGEATGLEWAAPASGGGLTLLETLSLSGATTTSATLSTSYKNLLVVVKGVYLAGNGTIYLRMNTDTGNNYSYAQLRMQGGSVSLNTGFLTNIIEMVDLGNNSTATENGYGVINIYRYNDTDIINCDFNFNGYIAGDQRNMMGTAYYDNSAAISTISFFTGSTFSAGTAYIYGVA
jgi:hypothetical protein